MSWGIRKHFLNELGCYTLACAPGPGIKQEGKINVRSSWFILHFSTASCYPTQDSLRLLFIPTEGIQMQNKNSRFCLSHFALSYLLINIWKQTKAFKPVNIMAGESLNQNLFTRERVLSRKEASDSL